MAEAAHKLANGQSRIDFATEPARYRHWRLAVDGAVATLTMDVDEKGGLFEGYDLKLNSYDLGVDIELADAFERIWFEHPSVQVVQLRSAKPRVFCAGANIRMLAGASHVHKVNFCKFTNETRNAIEDASALLGVRTIAVINGTAAGGGYELALAADHIVLVDDGSTAVSLPEVPLLSVLPGTGGLTRITDKRKVRRDHADVFCTTEEGVKGKRAVEWRLVDAVVPSSQMEAMVAAQSRAFAPRAPGVAQAITNDPGGVPLAPLERNITADRRDHKYVSVVFDRPARLATIMLRGPDQPPVSADEMMRQGAAFWPLRLARELDDAILDIRFNEADVAAIVFKSRGDIQAVLDYDTFLDAHPLHWLTHAIRFKWLRVLKRIDLTSRSLVALIEPGSCFAGTLAEIVFAADRSYMRIGAIDGDNLDPAAITLASVNFGTLTMGNGLSRLATRFLGEPALVEAARSRIGVPLEAEDAQAGGLVTFAVEAEFAPWRKLRRFQKSRMADVDYFSAQISGAEIDVLFTGIGGKSAWLETANAIYKSEIDVCISSGLAGGLRPEHQIGEILVAEKVLASPGDLVVLSEPSLVKSAVAIGAKRVPFFYTADRVVLRAAEKHCTWLEGRQSITRSRSGQSRPPKIPARRARIRRPGQFRESGARIR
jgi:benzoyl-CoA-dihydrodiol lyase